MNEIFFLIIRLVFDKTMVPECYMSVRMYGPVKNWPSYAKHAQKTIHESLIPVRLLSGLTRGLKC
jgi:hypothetical protein